MDEPHNDIVGRFFVAYGREGVLDQGWIIREISPSVYLVEFYAQIGSKYESVFRMVSAVEMRHWLFYENSDLAQQHNDDLFLESLPPIDLESISMSAETELEDLILEEIIRARKENLAERAKELEKLLIQRLK